MAQTEYKFEGWMGLDSNAAQGNMVWREFEPKEWEETDVDIKISHCGICGSDLHTLRSGWVCLHSLLLLRTIVSLGTDFPSVPLYTPAASDTRSWAPPCAWDPR